MKTGFFFIIQFDVVSVSRILQRNVCYECVNLSVRDEERELQDTKAQ